MESRTDRLDWIVKHHSVNGRLTKGGLVRVAMLTWRGRLRYSDIDDAGITHLRFDVWRKENDIAKAEIRKQWNENGAVVIDRPGVEMA